MIAFVGSVFSPTYYAARLEDPRPEPELYCGINVALYGPHRRWVFTEPPPHRIHRSAECFEVSNSAVRWDRDALVVQFDERTAALGRRVAGTIRVEPAATFDTPLPLDPAGLHHWWPVAPAARIEVACDAPALRFRGTGYHDANFGEEPLESRFRSWSWSRSDTSDGTVVLYDVVPRDRSAPPPRSLLFRPSGDMQSIEVPRRRDLPPTRWRVDRPTRTDADGEATVLSAMEDTPFYARSLVRSQLLGQNVVGVHESLDLARFTHPLVQFMLPFRMRRLGRA